MSMKIKHVLIILLVALGCHATYANEHYVVATNLYRTRQFEAARGPAMLAEQTFSNVVDKSRAAKLVADTWYYAGDRINAAPAYERVLSTYPDAPENILNGVRFLLVCNYAGLRQMDLAEGHMANYMQSSHVKSSQMRTAYSSLGTIYFIMGDQVKASNCYKQMLLLGGGITKWTPIEQRSFERVIRDPNDKEGYQKFCADLNFLVEPNDDNLQIKTLLTRLAQGL